MDTVEQLGTRIKDIQTRVNEQRDMEEKKKQQASGASAGAGAGAQSQQQQQQQQQKQQRTTPATTTTTTTTNESGADTDPEQARLSQLWKQLRLQVRLDVDDTGDAYVIQGYIAGLKNEDIRVQLSADGNSLTVSGTKLPTPREVTAMKKQLMREGGASVEGLLRLGSGR